MYVGLQAKWKRGKEEAGFWERREREMSEDADCKIKVNGWQVRSVDQMDGRKEGFWRMWREADSKRDEMCILQLCMSWPWVWSIFFSSAGVNHECKSESVGLWVCRQVYLYDNMCGARLNHLVNVTRCWSPQRTVWTVDTHKSCPRKHSPLIQAW